MVRALNRISTTLEASSPYTLWTLKLRLRQTLQHLSHGRGWLKTPLPLCLRAMGWYTMGKGVQATATVPVAMAVWVNLLMLH